MCKDVINQIYEIEASIEGSRKWGGILEEEEDEDEDCDVPFRITSNWGSSFFGVGEVFEFWCDDIIIHYDIIACLDE
jgi:hypothetical protein